MSKPAVLRLLLPVLMLCGSQWIAWVAPRFLFCFTANIYLFEKDYFIYGCVGVSAFMILCVPQMRWALQITMSHHVGAGNGTGRLPEQQVFLACGAIISALSCSPLETFSGDLETNVCGRHCRLHPLPTFLPSGFCGCWIRSQR